MARKWYYTLTYSHANEPHSTICGAQIEWHELKRRRKTQTHISKRLYRKSDVLNNNHKRYLTNVRLLSRVILPYSFCSSVYILCTWHRSYACNEAHCQDRNTAWHPILHQHTHTHRTEWCVPTPTCWCHSAHTERIHSLKHFNLHDISLI